MAPGNQWTTNTWDGQNRLTRVALPSGIADSFTYNGDGQRVQKHDSTGTTNHVWDEQNILLETNASNIIQVVYTLEPLFFGNLISQSRGGTDSFYLFDALGSTRQLTDIAGSVTDSYLYDSFGNALLTGLTTNPFRYVGRAGYYFAPDVLCAIARARFYRSSTGSFLTRDAAPSSILANAYVYCSNNPLSFIDPSGLTPAEVSIAPANLDDLQVDNCGPLSWTIKWVPGAGMVGNGYLVQQVFLRVDKIDCCTGKTRSCTTSYYEAWVVKQGKIVGGTDTFSLPATMAGGRGCLSVTGAARFIPLGGTKKAVQNQFPSIPGWGVDSVEASGDCQAMGIPSFGSGVLARTIKTKMAEDQRLWNEQWTRDFVKKNPADFASHQMRGEWNCCGGQGKGLASIQVGVADAVGDQVTCVPREPKPKKR